MSETMEYVKYLSSEIGPRPAGTEEERQAAEFIAEELETSSGLPTEIEDFSAPAGSDAPRAICAGLAVVGGILSLLLPMFGIPAVILLLIATALTVAEYLDKPLLQKVLSRGASQNVVAKYNPGTTTNVGRGRARKVVIVARYDSGKVRNELSGGLIKILPGLQKASFWSVPVLFVAVLIRSLFLATDTGFLGVLFTVLVFVGVVLSVIPLIFTLLHKMSPFNEAANSNAAGVAVMMEVAGRVGRGRMTEEQIEHLHQYDDLSADESAGEYVPVIHGEQEALAADILPADTEIAYEVEPTDGEPVEAYVAQEPAAEPEPAEETEADRLLAAKAAIAALTGVAVPATIATEYVREAEEAAPVAAAEATFAVAEEAAEIEGFALETAQKSMPAVPDWFSSAQAKAKANKPDAAITGKIKRSRYADALDAAVTESSAHFDSANRQALTGLDDQIARLNDGIVEVKAPGFEDEPVATTIVPEQVTYVPEPEPAPYVAEPEPVAPAFEAASGDVLDDVVSGFGAGLTDADIAMPSFLESNRFEPVVVTAPAEEVAPVEQQVVEEPVSPFVDFAPEPVEEAVQPVSDFVGSIADEFDTAQDVDASPSLSKKIPVILADTTGSFAAISDSQGQRAPLADSSSTAKSLLSMLPSINPSDPAEAAAAASIASLRTTLPSLSGTIPAVSSSSNTGTAGATGVFAPVTEEMVKAAETEDELFVEDADDSDYQENFTENGAFAGPDYIEMPKSPIRNFFDKIFHRKDKEVAYYDDQDGWSDDGYDGDDYEDSYDGGWADEGQEFGDYDDYDDYDEFDDEFVDGDEKWNGGALSALKDAASSVGGKASQAAQGVAGKVRGAAPSREPREERAEAVSSRRGRFTSLADEPVPFDDDPRTRFEEQREMSAEEGAYSDVDIEEAGRPEQFQQVETFRNPFVNSEVWFVALGSELAGNAGMRAFIDEHRDELRGALVIELDGLGAGTLSMVETEGTVKNVATSSRMKRYMRKVTQATGVSCANVKFDWNDSAASYANAHGVKAMHLVGEQGGKPAYFAQDNDVLESVEEQTLETNVECVMELLRLI